MRLNLWIDAKFPPVKLEALPDDASEKSTDKYERDRTDRNDPLHDSYTKISLIQASDVES